MAIFRVRNLLVQVLPRECEFEGSCDVGSGCDIDISDCGDTGGCDVTFECGDVSDCGDTGGCGDTEGCGDISDCGDTGGCEGGSDCGDTQGCGDASCADPTSGCGDTQGCQQSPDSTCPVAQTSGCDPAASTCTGGDSTCTAFDCSLHFDTICDVVSCHGPSVCQVPGVTLYCQPNGPGTLDCIFNNSNCLLPSNCTPGGFTIACHNPNTCDILLSLPTCPKVTDTRCGNVSVIAAAGLNPNSLADVVTLKRQLANALRSVQSRQRAMSKAIVPKTRRQIETAEAILTSALDELRKRKQFVQSRAAAAKKAAPAKKAATKKAAAKKAPAKKRGRRK